jgi:hypothetical protein
MAEHQFLFLFSRGAESSPLVFPCRLLCLNQAGGFAILMIELSADTEAKIEIERGADGLRNKEQPCLRVDGTRPGGYGYPQEICL